MGLVAPGSGPGGRWFKSTRPDHSFIINNSIAGKSRERPKNAWYETKHPCLMSAGRERSLFFEFIALQR
jgi:hypothetical protein